jgi:hypothetical protein
MSRKLVNVFENREMRFGFLVLCFALMGHRRKVMLLLQLNDALKQSRGIT